MLRPLRLRLPGRLVPFGRSVAVAVLVGYGAALGGTSAGHGLRLAVHLIAEHHEAHDGHDDAHHHDEAHEGHDAHHHDEPGHDDAGEVLHSHRGRVHSHREAPPVPALLSVELDKHCVFASLHVRVPGEARRLDWPGRASTPAPIVRAVEVRPPQRAA